LNYKRKEKAKAPRKGRKKRKFSLKTNDDLYIVGRNKFLKRNGKNRKRGGKKIRTMR